jgi:hypothetical protein
MSVASPTPSVGGGSGGQGRLRLNAPGPGIRLPRQGARWGAWTPMPAPKPERGIAVCHC